MPDTKSASLIDTHHHVMPDYYVEAIGLQTIAGQSAAGRVPHWSVEGSLAFMYEVGIDRAFMSISSPGMFGLEASVASAMTSRCNDHMAELAAAHPQRLRWYAYLHLPDVAAAVAEVRRASALGASAFGVLSNYQGVHIGDPAFWPVLEAIDQVGGIMHVHPTSPAGFTGVPGISVSTLEFPFESIRAIMSVLANGTASRFPAIRFVWSHAGGGVSAIAGRAAVLSDRHATFIDKGDKLVEMLGRFYFDLTQSTHPAALQALRTIVPDTQLFYGSDAPFAAAAMAMRAATELDAVAGSGFAAQTTANAERLFGWDKGASA